jgi:CheY-like chemotaxis protein
MLARPGEDTTRTRLLLVDDEPDLLCTLSEILQEYGYAVVSTWDGEEAVEIASVFEPNVVVTDYCLPGMDGVTTIRRMREDTPNLRAILVSGFISNATRHRAQAEHVDRILEKPLSVSELLQELEFQRRKNTERNGVQASAV